MKNNDKDIRVKEDRPVLAICYDFDKTLSPDDIDVTTFYRQLLKSIRKLSESAQAVKNILDDNEE